MEYVIKRNGDVVKFDKTKIIAAINAAMMATENESISEVEINDIVTEIEARLDSEKMLGHIWNDTDIPNINTIQQYVEDALVMHNFSSIARNYIEYRKERDNLRNLRNSISDTISTLLESDSKDSDLKRDNANINGDTAMGTMLQIGSNVSKNYYLNNMISKDVAKAHTDGYIYIHDLDFYALTVTCCQIDCLKLFKDGFNTGHGYLREPNSIGSYATLAAIAIQSDQNDCHGGQSIPNFDYSMAPGVYKTFKKALQNNTQRLKTFNQTQYDEIKTYVESMLNVSDDLLDIYLQIGEILQSNYYDDIKIILDDGHFTKSKTLKDIIKMSWKDTDNQCYQAMEGFVHNLNTLHSRAGSQVPFSSINLGSDTTNAGRNVTKNLLLAMEAGLGHGETAIFPIVVFKVIDGVSYNPEDPNYDLFKLSIRVSAKRLFPNWVFQNAPGNIEYYDPTRPETEICTMGCRTRVMGNVYDTSRQISHSRGNLSFTTINLPMLALTANGDETEFYNLLDKYLEMTKRQLLERYNIQAKRKVKNMPFLMGQHIWLDSDTLSNEDEVGEVLKHGTLGIGFIGLAECLIALYGHHHGEGKEYWDKGYAIIKYIRDFTDKASQETNMNFGTFATPAEGYCGKALQHVKKKFGVIPGITDKEFMTNSSHIPVYFPITIQDKIALEAPFHELENAGHICYIELDGDTTQQLDVMEKVVRCMHDSGVGYGAINHPVDRDPVCGYTGIINDECPNCHRHESNDERFERIRRITGYLSGSTETWNDAKQAEEKSRVKHN